MQIQARADGRRSLHPLCMLARALAWADCVLGPSATPLRASKPPDPTSASSVLVWPSCRSRVSAAARHRGYVKLRGQRNGAVHQGIRRSDRVRETRVGLWTDFAAPMTPYKPSRPRHDAQPIARLLRTTGTGEPL
jgi:hypothetical protein